MNFKLLCCCTILITVFQFSVKGQEVGEYLNRTSVQITNNTNETINFDISFDKKKWSEETIQPHRKEMYKMDEYNVCYARVLVNITPRKTDIYKLQKGKAYIINRDARKRKLVIKPVSTT